MAPKAHAFIRVWSRPVALPGECWYHSETGPLQGSLSPGHVPGGATGTLAPPFFLWLMRHSEVDYYHDALCHWRYKGHRTKWPQWNV